MARCDMVDLAFFSVYRKDSLPCIRRTGSNRAKIYSKLGILAAQELSGTKIESFGEYCSRLRLEATVTLVRLMAGTK
jgi:hypothetical protein